jgi:hypothetical protein
MPLSNIALPIVFAVLKVAAVAAVGFLLGKRSILHDSATADISDLVIKVAVPCLVFSNAAGGFVGMSSTAAFALVLAGPVILGCGYAFSTALAKVLRVDPAYRKAVVAASTFQNSAYLPLAVATSVAPIVASTSGFHDMSPSAAAGSAVICISLFGVLYSPIFWGIGLGWITDTDTDRRTPAQLVARLFPPPVIGLIAGYAVGLTPLHLLLVPHGAPLRFAFDAVSDIGGMTVPLANLILGAMLARVGSGRREPVRNHIIVTACRYLLVPGVVLTILLATQSIWTRSATMSIAAFVIFLQSITPPATNLAVMSKSIRGDSPYRTAEAIPRILLVAYLLCMLTMPAWLMIFLRLLHTG